MSIDIAPINEIQDIKKPKAQAHKTQNRIKYAKRTLNFCCLSHYYMPGTSIPFLVFENVSSHRAQEDHMKTKRSSETHTQTNESVSSTERIWCDHNVNAHSMYMPVIWTVFWYTEQHQHDWKNILPVRILFFFLSFPLFYMLSSYCRKFRKINI